MFHVSTRNIEKWRKERNSSRTTAYSKKEHQKDYRNKENQKVNNKTKDTLKAERGAFGEVGGSDPKAWLGMKRDTKDIEYKDIQSAKHKNVKFFYTEMVEEVQKASNSCQCQSM